MNLKTNNSIFRKHLLSIKIFRLFFLLIAGTISLSLNASPTTTCVKIQATCLGTTLSSQAEVNAWTDCDIVEGNLIISGTDITDLSPLLSLQKVRGLLSVSNNAQLVSLSGLENVDSVEALFITDNQQLPDLTGINLTQTEIAAISISDNQHLQTINGFDNFTRMDFMSISRNDNLSSITGFNGLMTVEDDLLIGSNINMTSLDGFSSLIEIKGQLLLSANNSLESIDGFENLTTMGGSFIIASNDRLKSINGFTSLYNLTLIAIANNAELENVDVFSTITNFDGDLYITDNASLSDCCGVYPIINSGTASLIDINGNPMFCANETEIINFCGTGIDLELNLTQSDPTPNQWTTYTITATLSNTSIENATGIRVSMPSPDGIVYTGGNEWTTSQGNFDHIGSEEWIVGNISAGNSATLTVSYFLLAEESPLTYAQVIIANESDSDSSPNNGTPPTVNEDDEASTGGGGPPNLTQDMTISGLDIPSPTILPGLVLDYNFDLTNLGTGAIPGTFSVKSYISTDNILSANDIQDGIVPTGNFGPGLTVNDISGASTIPDGLAAGNYFLIVKVDADDVVTESNENNNIVFQAFTVNAVVSNCNGDIELNTQAEVDAFGPCTTYQGNITINGTGINNLNSFAGLQLLDGDLDIRTANSLEDLNGLESLQNIDGDLSIQSNTLRDISALSSLTNIVGSFQLLDARMTSLTGLENLASVGFLFFRDLDFITDLNPLSNLTNVDKTLWLSSNQNLADISGLSNLNHVEGLDLRAMSNITDLSPLGNISGQLDERLLIMGMGGLNNLDGLENITGVLGRVQVSNSDALENIDGFLRLVSAGEFLLTGNSSLADCCGAYPLLNGNGVSGLVLIDDNLAGCSSAQEILDNCSDPLRGCDAISITSGPGEITISGLLLEPHVLLKVFRPNWTVAFDCLDNACSDPLTVSGLSNGDHHVEIKLFDENWEEICTILQKVTVSGSNNQNREQDGKQQGLAIDKIYPNPSSHWVTFEIYSPEIQVAPIDFYNQQGQLVHHIEVALNNGLNEIELEVGEWKSGIYHVISRGTGRPAYGRFLRMWED